jgi:hypothetical protein
MKAVYFYFCTLTAFHFCSLSATCSSQVPPVGLEVDSIEIIQLEFVFNENISPNKRPMRGGSSFSFLQRLAAVPPRDLGRVWRSDLLDFS